jgi:hypothetical protein
MSEQAKPQQDESILMSDADIAASMLHDAMQKIAEKFPHLRFVPQVTQLRMGYEPSPEIIETEEFANPEE